jgi:hypothetical protein
MELSPHGCSDGDLGLTKLDTHPRVACERIGHWSVAIITLDLTR